MRHDEALKQGLYCGYPLDANEDQYMKYCSSCGSDQLEFRVPAGDNRPRHVCASCNNIHYQNPRIIAGCLPVHEGKVLLCKRAIEPRYGFWTLPAGFMENGETLEEAAQRESLEEAEAEVVLEGLYTVFNLPHISQVYMLFRGTLKNGAFGVGEESLETRLFSEEEIPWEELAFPTIAKTLKYYFEDRKNNDFPIRVRDIPAMKKKPAP